MLGWKQIRDIIGIVWTENNVEDQKSDTTKYNNQNSRSKIFNEKIQDLGSRVIYL
jgi:hypothetical protein